MPTTASKKSRGHRAGKRSRPLKPCKPGQARKTTKPKRCVSLCERYKSKDNKLGKCKYRKTTGGKRTAVVSGTTGTKKKVGVRQKLLRLVKAARRTEQKHARMHRYLRRSQGKRM